MAAASHFQAFPVLDEKGKTVGIFSKSDFLKRWIAKLILVDHNELSQAVQGADQADIIEIIDHHRIGRFHDERAYLFRNEPVGSTSTIVADCFLPMRRWSCPAPLRGCCWLAWCRTRSNLTSPTTTERDAEILKRLEAIAGVDADRVHREALCLRVGLDFPPAPKR